MSFGQQLHLDHISTLETKEVNVKWRCTRRCPRFHLKVTLWRLTRQLQVTVVLSELHQDCIGHPHIVVSLVFKSRYDSCSFDEETEIWNYAYLQGNESLNLCLCWCGSQCLIWDAWLDCWRERILSFQIYDKEQPWETECVVTQGCCHIICCLLSVCRSSSFQVEEQNFFSKSMLSNRCGHDSWEDEKDIKEYLCLTTPLFAWLRRCMWWLSSQKHSLISFDSETPLFSTFVHSVPDLLVLTTSCAFSQMLSSDVTALFVRESREQTSHRVQVVSLFILKGQSGQVLREFEGFLKAITVSTAGLRVVVPFLLTSLILCLDSLFSFGDEVDEQVSVSIAVTALQSWVDSSFG